MGLTSVGSLLQQPNPLQQLQALQAHHLVRLSWRRICTVKCSSPHMSHVCRKYLA